MVIRRESFSLVLGRDAEKMAARSSPSDLSLTNIEGLCVRACVRERASVCAVHWEAGDISHTRH